MFAAYGPIPGLIVPLDRWSATIFDISCISFCGRRSNLPGNEAGALGSNSMAWSHTVCSGSLCDCCSLNTLACQWKALGTFDRSASADMSSFPIVTFAMKYQSVGHIGLGTFCVRSVNFVFYAFEARRTTGSWVWSIHPRFQSIRGCIAENQGYPSIALCSPRSDRKNHSVVLVDPVWTSRSV